MKLNKILLFAALAAGMMLTSCKDEDQTLAPEAGDKVVSFIDEENLVLNLTDTDFDIKLTRVDRDGTGELPKLTVPLKVLTAPDFLTVPTSAVFADGETETSITVQIGEGMEAFKDYTLSLMIDESYTDPYADSLSIDLQPRYNITLVKEDYAKVATGLFHEQVLYGQNWEVEIEYSPLLDLYRIPDAIVEGTHWFFRWNGKDVAQDDQKFYFTDSTGKKASCTVNSNEYHGFFSGVTHKTYGNIFVVFDEEYFYGYDVENDEFDFVAQYIVPAGSFGKNWEWIDNIEWE